MKFNSKKLRHYLIAATALLLGACGEEINTMDVITPSHSVIKVSQDGNQNLINIDQSIDFADVSRGIVSREWIFPEEEGAVSMEGNPTDAQVRGIFHKVGTWEVKLHQEFQNQPYIGEEILPIDGTTFDTLIKVTVMPAVKAESLKANLIYANGEIGEELPLETATPTEIPFGSVVRFTYSAIGSPTVIQGDFQGAQFLGTDLANYTFDVKYVTLDETYGATVVFVRPEPESRDTLVVADFVKCVRSSDPVKLDGIFNEGYENVHVSFSRGLNASTLSPEDFTVKIKTKDGAELAPNFKAALNALDESIVVLTLDGERIYSDDQVMVSYQGGNLETADKAPVDYFEDLPMELIEVNLLEEANYDYSFESSTVNWLGGQPAWLGGDFSNTIEKTSVMATEGSKSLKISVDPFDGTGVANATVIQPFENGAAHNFSYTPEGANKVKIAFDTYVEDNGGAIDPRSSFYTNLRMHLNWGAGGAEKAHSLGDAQVGEWLELTDIIGISNITPSYGMVIKIAQTGVENFTVYVDNIRVTRWNPRP